MANQITPVSTEPPPSDSHDKETKTKGEGFFMEEETSTGKDQKTHPSPSNPLPVADEEANTRLLPLQYLRRRRCLLCCSGCCGATVLVVGFTLLILSFTVFKVKDPTLTMNGIFVNSFEPGIGTSWSHPLSLNATFTVDVSVKNPNVASFAYGNSTTRFYYHGQIVGVAYVPDGRVGADRTARMNATLDVLVDRIAETNPTDNVLDRIAETNATDNATVRLTSFTDFNGRVNVIGIYKKDIEVMLNCSMSLDLNSQSQIIKNPRCLANVR